MGGRRGDCAAAPLTVTLEPPCRSGGILRSALAFLAGAVAIVVLSLATDTALEALHLTPPQSDPGAFTPPMLLAATAYRSLYAMIGSAIAARLAPKAPMAHALSLGVLGVVANIAGAWVNRSYGNHWYPIALVITALPCAWVGACVSSEFMPSRRSGIAQ